MYTHRILSLSPGCQSSTTKCSSSCWIFVLHFKYTRHHCHRQSTLTSDSQVHSVLRIVTQHLAKSAPVIQNAECMTWQDVVYTNIKLHKKLNTATTKVCMFCIAAGSVASVCLWSKRKTAWAITTKVGRHIVHGRTSACTDLRSKGRILS